MGRSGGLRAALVSALVVVGSLGASAAVAQSVHVAVEPRNQREVDAVWRLAEHVLAPHDPVARRHSVVVSRQGLARLRAMGIAVEPLGDSLDHLTAPEAPETAVAAVVAWGGRLGIFEGFYTRVRTLAEIDARMEELARGSQGRARVVVLGRSVEGREIRGLRVLAGPDANDDRVSRAAVLVTGTHHAREWASPMVTLGLAEALLSQYLVDPAVRRLVNTLAVFVVPVVNVDGYVATHSGQRLLRKNMRPRCAVDLNRNYEVAFGLGAPAGGCDQDSYPGPSPFSEPETRAVRDLAESLPNLKLFLDYHAPAEQVMIPFAHTRERPPGFEISRGRAQRYAEAVKLLYGTVHPAREGYDLAQGQGGGAIDWFRTRGVESFAVELRDGRELAGFELPADQLIPSAEENWTGFFALAGALAAENPRPGGGPPEEIFGDGTEPPPSGSQLAAVGCSASGQPTRGAGGWFAIAPLFVALLRRRRR